MPFHLYQCGTAGKIPLLYLCGVHGRIPGHEPRQRFSRRSADAGLLTKPNDRLLDIEFKPLKRGPRKPPRLLRGTLSGPSKYRPAFAASDACRGAQFSTPPGDRNARQTAGAVNRNTPMRVAVDGKNHMRLLVIGAGS